MMNAPKIRCNARKDSLTITLPFDSWPCSRDFFAMISDAIKQKAWDLSAENREDAVYLESIADAVADALQRSDKRERPRAGA